MSLIHSAKVQKLSCCDERPLTDRRSLTDFSIPCQVQVHIHSRFVSLKLHFLQKKKKNHRNVTAA